MIDKNLEEFTIQKEEVEEIKWFTKEKLINELDNNPEKFIKSIKEYINLFN